MNLFAIDCRCNSIESHDAVIRSSDELSPSSEDYSNEDYYRARNYYHRRNYAAHKAVLERAYRFIYDEDFSTEITSETDFSGDNYAGKDPLDENLVPGDGTGVFSFEKRLDKSKSGKRSDNRSSREYLRTKRRGIEVSSLSETQQICLKNQRNATGNRGNMKTRTGPKIFAKNMQNFGETWRNDAESFLKNSSSFYCRNLDTRRFDSDLQSPSSEKTRRNQKWKVFSDKNSKKISDLGPNTFHRKRKFPSVELQGSFNCPEDSIRRKSEENSSRLLKPRNRLKRISKMRKMYSEQIIFNELRKKNNESLVYDVESSSSEESFVIEVEKILQGNMRGRKNCFTVETVLLENKNRQNSNFSSSNKVERRKGASSCHKYTTNTQSNEMKLLEDIKRRIDDDFECDLTRIKALSNRKENSKITGEESSKVISSLESRISNKDKFSNSNISKNVKTNDSVNAASKSSTSHFVDSIDSGVSTDFSRTESDNLSKNDRYLGTKTPSCFSNDVQTPISQDDQNHCEMVPFYDHSNDSNDQKILDEQVEKAVRRFTEELIMCERRAVDRGLIDKVRDSVARKIRKPFQKVSHSDSSEPDTFFSPHEFSKTSQSSSEDEYLENISPPSLCSISDSEMENLHDFDD